MLGARYDNLVSPNRMTPRADNSFQGAANPNMSKGMSTRDTTQIEDFEGFGGYRQKSQMHSEYLTHSNSKRPDLGLFSTQARSSDTGSRMPEAMMTEVQDKTDENLVNAMNVTKKIGLVIEKSAEFSIQNEYSQNTSVDDIQWTLDHQIDIPDMFKQEINAYKMSGEKSLRLERRVFGYHGVLAYILKNKLLAWFYEDNRTLVHEFEEPIQSIEFTSLPPPAGITGIPQCLLVASLQNGLTISTITLINGLLQVVQHQEKLVGQFDGVFYERLSGRLFVMERSQNLLQEIITSKNGQRLLGGVLKKDNQCNSKSRLRMSETSSRDPLKMLTDMFFSTAFNYRTHKFSFDSANNRLYVLQSKWKGSLGFDDKILGQTIGVYSILGASFDWWGELKIEQTLQDTTSKKGLNKLSSIALREIKNNKIVGISTSQGDYWNVTLMYDNGCQIRLLVLPSITKKGFSCLLNEYIGRKIETDTAQHQQNILAQPFYQSNIPAAPEGAPITTAYQGLDSIQAVVHKQTIGRKVRICVENRLSKVTAASTFKTTNQLIYPVERAHTATFSTILKVIYFNKAGQLHRAVGL